MHKPNCLQRHKAANNRGRMTITVDNRTGNEHKTTHSKFLTSGSMLHARTCQKHHGQHLHTSVLQKNFNHPDSVQGPLKTRQSGPDN